MSEADDTFEDRAPKRDLSRTQDLTSNRER
jgi:hypothetical protein